MEIYINPNFIKSVHSQNKRTSTASATKLRVIRNQNPALSGSEKQPMDMGDFSVRSRQDTKATQDVLTQNRIQPLMVQNYLDMTKRRVVDQPENTIRAQANLTADIVNGLLA